MVPDALLNPIPVPVAANAAVLSEDTPRESSTEQLARLDRHTDQYHRQLATLDDQLRRAATPLQADDLSSCVERLEAAHDEFLTQQNALDQIDLPIGASAELEAVHRRLVTLWQQQCTAIGEAQQALSAFEPAGDLSRQREALIDRNHRLLSLGHELRDTLGETMVAMPRAEMEAVRRGATASGDDELLDRFQLDAFLAKWWTEHAGDEVPLAAAAVDIDELAQVNRQCGPLAGDHVLSAVAQVVASVCGKECPVCHFSGDTFLVLLPTIKLHDATALIERIRQQVEHTRFTRQGQSLQVTVSCGVTQICPGDDTKKLLDRVAAALNEAKRYGHNRTFAHEGKYPTPVMPPSLEISEKSVEL